MAVGARVSVANTFAAIIAPMPTTMPVVPTSPGPGPFEKT